MITWSVDADVCAVVKEPARLFDEIIDEVRALGMQPVEVGMVYSAYCVIAGDAGSKTVVWVCADGISVNIDDKESIFKYLTRESVFTSIKIKIESPDKELMEKILSRLMRFILERVDIEEC